MVSAKAAFVVERSIPHGHVEAILATIRNLVLDRITSSKLSRGRNLEKAMVAERRRLLDGGLRFGHGSFIQRRKSFLSSVQAQGCRVLSWGSDSASSK